VLFSALASRRFLLRTIDVRTAFLQGMPLDRLAAVYVQPPPQSGAPAGVVWRLCKCAYGLTDAPGRWYESVLVLMRASGLVRWTVDHGLYTRHADGVLVLAVAVHVDDFLFGGTASEVRRFEATLRERFAAGSIKVGAFTFTGLAVAAVVDMSSGALSLRVNLDEYVESIVAFSVSAARRAEVSSPLTAAELTLYRRATGALLWATGQTYPFLECEASMLARRFTD